MKRFFSFCIMLNSFALPVFASSMFDDNGNYSGNWKQMTNVGSGSSAKYNSNSYSTHSWYANVNEQRAQNAKTSYSNRSVNKMDTMPYRYNTLDYTRVRKVKGGHGDYNAKCTDIGDASFCR